MKTILRSFTFVVLAVAGGMVMLAGNAQGVDEVTPPEVKALIGMKIPPKAQGRRGEVSGWVNLWGSGIVNSIFFEVWQRENITILAIGSSIDQSTSILDARVIQGDLLWYYTKDGKTKWKKNEMQWYRITETCWRDNAEQKEIIIGMWRYEPNSKCTDTSTLVKKAWILNPENGRLTDIPTQDVSCREPVCGED